MSFAKSFLPCLVAFTLALAPSGMAQDPPADTVRYKFDPPLGIAIVQSVDTRNATIALGGERVERWTHDVVMTLDETVGDDQFSGTFQLRNVVNVENAQDNVFYLIARAIEGETYDLVMYDFGLAAEVDWAAITARIGQTLPDLTGPENVAAVEAALPVFADPTKAVLRALDTVGLSYVIPFRADGELNTVETIGGLTYFAVEPSSVEVAGGLDAGIGEYIIDWLVTADVAVATAALADQLRGLADTVDAALGTDSSATIEAAIADGIQMAEDGYTIYDYELGLLRESTVTAIIHTEPVTYATRITVERLEP